MDVREVHDLVRRGRVVKSPRYHPGRRGLGFQEILLALERCHHVARDERVDDAGEPLHPRGWYALANLPHRRRLRVDFDLHEDPEGSLLLVVTAYHA